MLDPKPLDRYIYNHDMARGWESKSVEAQQEEAKQATQRTSPALTPAQAARKRQLEVLKLSRQRVREQLASSPDARRRRMLENAMADLDQQIKMLEV